VKTVLSFFPDGSLAGSLAGRMIDMSDMNAKTGHELEEMLEERLLSLYRKIAGCAGLYKTSPLLMPFMDQIDNALDIIADYQAFLSEGTSDPDSFMTVGQLEGKLLSLNRRLSDANLKAFSDALGRLPASGALAAKKKPDSWRKG
jgi:hypothetical protein